MIPPRVTIVGSGGREHAIAQALMRSASAPRVRALPGNPGFDPAARHAIALDDHAAIVDACQGEDLVVIGPEAPLVAGLADRLRSAGCAVLGPSAAAARLEGSKAFAKSLMDRAGVPTARWARFEAAGPAQAFARELGPGAVVKADGLAAGKGVVVADDRATADAAIEAFLGGAHGVAGTSLVVEERLHGEELSVIALCDGERLRVLPPSQDHKRLLEGDEGPNTGGMGAYAPAPRATPDTVDVILRTCMQPVVDTLRDDGHPLVGVLYAGLMLTPSGPRVLEYNVRFGDPETQAILPLVDEDLYLSFRDAAEGRLTAGVAPVRAGAALTVVLAAAGYPQKPRKGDAIVGLAAAEDVPGVSVQHAGTRRDADGVLRTAGGRVLGVTAVGADLETAARSAYAAVAEVRFEGKQYREDIAHRALGGAVG